MEVSTLIEVFSKFGPAGLTFIMMGAGLVYITRWVRDLQDKWIGQHEVFTKALDLQQDKANTALRETVAEFKTMHKELGDKVDRLADRVDGFTRK